MNRQPLERFEVVIEYTNGTRSRLSANGRTDWAGFLRAARHAQAFIEARHDEVVKATVQPVYIQTNSQPRGN